jgi:predicted Zn-dependent peptidase
VTRNHAVHGLLDDPAPYMRLDIRDPQSTEIYFVNKESAQAHVQIDSDSVVYNPALGPVSQLYNSYFADGMAGIVFQELREARALAYVAAARYMTGNRKGDRNYMTGIIQTQPDKTMDALGSFIELLDNMPKTDERFAAAREALLNSYATNRISFRHVTETILGWERRGISADPRPQWYETIKETEDLSAVAAFQQKYVANRPKIVSIVGDKNRINLDALKSKGSVKELQVNQLFTD